MGEIIARNMLSWLELLINRYCCIFFVVYIIVSVMHDQTNIELLLFFGRYEHFYLLAILLGFYTKFIFGLCGL